MVSSIPTEKAETFLKFHHDEEILVLLNSWDKRAVDVQIGDLLRLPHTSLS